MYGFQSQVLQDSSHKVNFKKVVQILKTAGELTEVFIENKLVCSTNQLYIKRGKLFLDKCLIRPKTPKV